MNNQVFQAKPDPMLAAQKNYQYARGTILSILVLTVVNIIMALVGWGGYFLYSAQIPYTIAFEGALFKYAPEGSLFAEIGVTAAPGAVMAVTAVVALVLLVPYLLCWLFSKNRTGWMIAALVLFAVDTLWMVSLYQLLSILLDLLLHLLILGTLGYGVYNGFKFKKLAEKAAEEAAFSASAEVGEAYEAEDDGAAGEAGSVEAADFYGIDDETQGKE